MTPEKRSTAPVLQDGMDRAEGICNAVPSITAGTKSEGDFVAALAGESIAEAARLIVLAALSAESAARRGDMQMAFSKLQSVARALRKLVPGLALIGHLADGGGAIGEAALLRALAFAEYLETHARRAYGAASEAETASAKAILSRIQRGELADGFTARDIYRKQWAHLSDREQVQAGLDLLTDSDWLELRTTPTSGRTRASYAINPKGARA